MPLKILNQQAEGEVKDILDIEKEFKDALEESKMLIRVMIDVVKYLAKEKREREKRIVTIN